MEEKVLSASELLECHKNRHQFNLPSFGDKIPASTGSAQEQRVLQRRLDDLQEVLSNPRVSQRSQLSEAVWSIGKGKATVTRQCGKHWEVMGHTIDNVMHLHTEEALFLLETNALEITLSGIPMSVQQSYQVMLGDGCSLSEYRAYSFLTRQGYKVVRHQGNLGFTSYEGKIKLDQYKAKKRKNADPIKDASSPKVIVIDDENCADLALDKNNCGVEVVELMNDNDECEIVEQQTNESDISDTTRNRILDKITSLYQMSEVTVATPSTDLLPYRVWPKKSNYILKMVDNPNIPESKVAKTIPLIDADISSSIQLDHANDDDDIVIVESSIAPKKHRKLYNQYIPPSKKGKRSKGQKVKSSKIQAKWLQFQHRESAKDTPEIVTLSDNEEDFPPPVLLQGPSHALWSGPSVPLIRPYQATSTQSILAKLSLKPIEPVDDLGAKLKISFDIYGPNVHFRKSSPRLPNFRVVVVKNDDPVPTKADLKATIGSIADKVPILFAIVSQSDVSMFNLFPVELPTEIAMG